MEKLTSEHLVPYLDKKLQGIDSYTNRKCNLVGLNLNSHEPLIIQMKPEYPTSKRKLVEFKPILHPLSDFTRQNSVDICEYSDVEDIVFSGNPSDLYFINTEDKTYLSDYTIASLYLFKHHFDVFGLIEKGLAIDINTLK